VTDPTLARLRLDYKSALVGYLSHRGETQLHSAYELGRSAITGRVGLLEVVQVHNSVTLDLLRATGGDDRLEIAEAAGAFLVEVLAASDMAQRAFLEGTHPPDEG
jgi:Phosphoserine phosphatase RsbU, N-terminal domain